MGREVLLIGASSRFAGGFVGDPALCFRGFRFPGDGFRRGFVMPGFSGRTVLRLSPFTRAVRPVAVVDPRGCLDRRGD